MANTHSSIDNQIIFATKGRQSFIHPSWEEELFKYINGIVSNNGQKMPAINSMMDHIHIFI